VGNFARQALLDRASLEYLSLARPFKSAMCVSKVAEAYPFGEIANGDESYSTSLKIAILTSRKLDGCTVENFQIRGKCKDGSPW
jgi:hypothetical protein